MKLKNKLNNPEFHSWVICINPVEATKTILVFVPDNHAELWDWCDEYPLFQFCYLEGDNPRKRFLIYSTSGEILDDRVSLLLLVAETLAETYGMLLNLNTGLVEMVDL